MILEIIPREGVMRGRPIRLPASQVLIRQDNGPVICVAAECGDDRSQAVAKVGDPDFRRLLAALGVHETVICDRLELPQPPPGARLVSGPTGG